MENRPTLAHEIAAMEASIPALERCGAAPVAAEVKLVIERVRLLLVREAQAGVR